MSIVCLEGASAVGKTTVSKLLEKEFGYVRIAEVNELFERSINESSTWYFERQIDRWKLAREVSRKGGVAVLDGDPFQPVWYNWIFANDGLQPLNKVFDFYQCRVQSGDIEFPNKYIVLKTPRSELSARKESDPTRSRRNFDKHLKLIEPQFEYFKAMCSISLNSVEFIESDNPRNVADKIVDLDKPINKLDSLEVLNAIHSFVESRT
jgi:deoxyadenosine/deoxycytidine kinase